MPYVRTRLGRWFYEQRGEPRRPEDAAIVLMHGFLMDGRMWRGQLGPLSEIGRVIVLDGPGHGKSEPPPRFSLEDHADALLDVFAELGVQRAALVGLSWGGMVAMRMAIQHAERVAALALLDTSSDAEPRALRVRYRLLAALARRLGLPPGVMDREVAPKLFSEGFRRAHPEVVVEYMNAAQGFAMDGLARACLAVLVKRTSVTHKLSGVHHPTLVLVGGEDVATSISRSETIAREIRGSRLVVVPGAGHMSAIEQPERVAKELVTFLQPVLGE